MTENMVVENKTTQLVGTVTALSSIIHSEILDEGQNPNVKPRRTETVVCQHNGETLTLRIPVVSGNGVRGLGRRLLFDHTFAQLGVTVGELFPKQDVLARRIQTAFRAGGVTPAGMTAKAAAPEKYKKLRDTIPMLGALGMVFHAHQFEGSSRVGFLRPYLKETASLFDPVFPMALTEKIENEAPSYAEFVKDAHLQKTRYTRRSESGAIEDASGESDIGVEKEAMIYGSEYLPAGTILGTSSRITTDNEGAKLAFLAMYGLLSENGVVGGMSGRGHGFVSFELYEIEEGGDAKVFDASAAIANYDAYLAAHKEEIIDAIKTMPELFGYVSKAAKKAAKEAEK